LTCKGQLGLERLNCKLLSYSGTNLQFASNATHWSRGHPAGTFFV